MTKKIIYICLLLGLFCLGLNYVSAKSPEMYIKKDTTGVGVVKGTADRDFKKGEKVYYSGFETLGGRYQWKFKVIDENADGMYYINWNDVQFDSSSKCSFEMADTAEYLTFIKPASAIELRYLDDSSWNYEMKYEKGDFVLLVGVLKNDKNMYVIFGDVDLFFVSKDVFDDKTMTLKELEERNEEPEDGGENDKTTTEPLQPWPSSDPNVSGIISIDNALSGVWKTIVIVIQVVAFIGIIIVGIRYMFVSADKKSEIKKSLIFVILGIILIFGAQPLVKAIYIIFSQML